MIFTLFLSDDFISFADEGVYLYPNPNFLAKNEDPGCRRGPIFISQLLESDGFPHRLCPVFHLRRFLSLTEGADEVKLKNLLK